MRERLKTLDFAAKKVVSKETRNKAKKIKDKHERIDALSNSVMSQLDLKFHSIETVLKDLEKKEVEVFHLFAKAKLLKSRIKYYNITHHKEDFVKVISLLGEIEKDLDSL